MAILGPAAAGNGERPARPVRAPVIVETNETHSRLSFELRELARLHRASGPAVAAAFAMARGIAVSNAAARVVVETTADEIAAVKERVAALRGTVETTASDLVLARVPISALEALASAGEVRIIRRPRTFIPLATTSEGLKVIGADTWHSAGRKGAGVKIAILDLGFDGYETLLGNELPDIPPSHIRSFSGDITGGGQEHGAAVAEIVYDVAPDAELYLVNFSTDVDLENAVQWLIDQRVNVINASWGAPCGSQDGTGRTQALVKRAADAGILWVNAAGNHAQHHWSGTFNDTNSDGFHNFSADDDGNSVHMEGGDELEVCIAWDDWTTRDQDYDLYVWDSKLNLIASSRNDQSGPNTEEPLEHVQFAADVSGDYFIGIKKEHATRNAKVHIFAFPPGSGCAIASVADQEPDAKGLLAELRRFRDVVLASSPFGRSLTRSYYRHSSEVIRILLRHPRLGAEALALLKESRPAVRSVLAARAGQANEKQFVISAAYAARVDHLLDQLAAHGSAALRGNLADVRAKAPLSAAVGQSADRYWEHLLIQAPPLESSGILHAYPERGYMRYVTAATSLVAPADSPYAFTVGAVNWATNTLEEFSSRGPTVDGRLKPEISAPDGVCTVTYGACGENGFLGTSAAAPHVTGAAGLVKQVNPSGSITDIRNFLMNRAFDLPPAGPDNQHGAGRLALGSPTGSDPGSTAAPTPSAPKGSNASLWPTFSWSAVAGAASYRLMVSTNAAVFPSDPASSACNGCAINATTQNPSFFALVPLRPNTTYYWQVQARVGGNNGPWSSAASFTTRQQRSTRGRQ